MASAAQNMPDEYSDMVETDLDDLQDGEGSGSGPLPTITLDFGNGKGGAWDDRELIRAYDAAMDEFHAHHPGPGSWLDKATAALEVGKPLPGALPTTSKWYSASAKASSLSASTNGNTPVPDTAQRPAKKQKTSRAAVNPYAGPSVSTARQRGPSPSYAPPSPSAAGNATEDGEDDYSAEVDEEQGGYAHDEDWQEGEENWYDESFALSQPQLAQPQPPAQPPVQISQPAPSFGVQNTSATSISDAFSYAMTAQYWAGYWMGVAQAKVQTDGPPPAPPITASSAVGPSAPLEAHRTHGTSRPNTNGPTKSNSTSNVLVTRRHFNRPQRALRR